MSSTIALDASLKCPFVAHIFGPTQAGKSWFTARLVNYQASLLETPATEIAWFTPHGRIPSQVINTGARTSPSVQSFRELPTDWDDFLSQHGFDSPKTHTLLILDDFAVELSKSSSFTNLVTRGSHHANISIILLTQVLCQRTAEAATQRRNAHYVLLLKSSRDFLQIDYFARQIFGNNRQKINAFMKIYHEATNVAYGHLLCSFHPRDPPELLFRSRIFPNEQPNIVYRITDK